MDVFSIHKELSKSYREEIDGKSKTIAAGNLKIMPRVSQKEEGRKKKKKKKEKKKTESRRNEKIFNILFLHSLFFRASLGLERLPWSFPSTYLVWASLVWVWSEFGSGSGLL